MAWPHSQDHNEAIQSPEIVLDEKPHPLKIEFHEGTGTAMMYFGWVPEGGTEQAVPLEALYHDGAQEKLYGK